LQTLTVVSFSNATVNIPPFTPGTFDPVTVTFTVNNTDQPVDFILRAASQFHAVFIRVRCAQTTCTPSATVIEGDLAPGGISSFGVSTGPGSVTVDHVNAGTGLQSLTVVGTPMNAVVNIPAFTPGTFDPVVVTFTIIDPDQPVGFMLRAASSFHAIFIRVRCGTPPRKPELSVLPSDNMFRLTNLTTTANEVQNSAILNGEITNRERKE
jgi:phosphopantetheine adenylyltransferase